MGLQVAAILVEGALRAGAPQFAHCQPVVQQQQQNEARGEAVVHPGMARACHKLHREGALGRQVYARPPHAVY